MTGRAVAGARMLRSGMLGAVVTGDGLGAVHLDGVEVLRGLTHPVRNPDWGTYLTRVLDEEAGGSQLKRRFAETGGTFHGILQVVLSPAGLEAEVELTFPDGAMINRAGFTLLHPIRGVAGTALTLLHPDGRKTVTRFPALISPDQPARDIVGMRHVVEGVEVEIAMQGDVFEMEDQRNWSDASFKTYCRPLALPFPYRVARGETLRQKVRIALSAEGSGRVRAGRRDIAPVKVPLPQVLLAHEAGLSQAAALGGFPGLPVLLRLDRATPDADLQAVAERQTALEIVFDDAADLAAQIERARILRPVRVTALPRPYLKSHQPTGPWPDGPRPADSLGPLRAGFPTALVGGGSLTNFTELNRCRPSSATVDFVTFGNTAIVHAADDLSVWQTLEAVPDILASASAIAAGRPLHLGLFSIGMRSNPYGHGVAPNPQRLRLPMAMEDPRQTTGFAAIYAVAVLALAARSGVSSLALAMPGGPLGAVGPLAEVIRQAHAMAGHDVTITGDDRHILISDGHHAIAANLLTQAWHVPGLGTVGPENALCGTITKE